MASPFIVHDPEFLRTLGDAPRLDWVLDVDAHEGPVYVAHADALYFTSLPTPHGQVAIRRITLNGELFPLAPDRVETVVQHTRVANGMTLDADGQLLVCEQGSMAEPAAISRVDPRTGARSVVVDNWGGLPLNSPNDVVVRSDGSVWFTDPSYGHLQGFRPEPQAGDHVYRWDPRTGMLTVVADDFVKPNGLAFSPDESSLYVTDSGANQEAGSFYPHLPHHVIAYDVDQGRHLVNRRLFAVTNPGFPDGLKVDADGRVYASSFSGVQVFSPLGDFIGEISLPGAVNFCFGGRAGNVLFITTDTAVWAATLVATGVTPLAAQQIRSGSGTKELRMTTIRTRRVIDEAGVDSVLRAAERHARAKGYRVVITVVDRAGNALALRRTPGAQVASSVVAVDKARTAAIFVRPSRDIEQQVSSGRLGALALHGAAALTGGIPLRADGEVVGAIGTSGETPDQDESVSLAGAAVSFTTTEVPALTYETARRVAETVGTVATGRGVAPVAAVVDAEGHLVYLWRPDSAQVASVSVATDKARTAAIYRRPSKDFEDQAAGGRPSALHLARAVPLQGGMPLLVDGHVIGAVGVSGASSADEDQELAVLGSEAPSPHNAATYIPKQKVHEQFQTGGLLLQTSSYKLDAGRRTGPGAVELHDHETDIMHVVHGRATVVTGEDKHLLNEGDVLVIPNGVPHQFVHVTAPFFYFVTKVQS